MKPQRIALLGSTGSIGAQTLEVIRRHGSMFEAAVLCARSNWETLARQAREFMPDSVVIADERHYAELRQALDDLPVKVYAGADAVRQVVAGDGVDTVVNAVVGYAGLGPTVSALSAGKKLALANKESLVVAGEMVMKLALDNRAPIIPVDSEHSAIFQCLAGETGPIAKILLTASGGPFLDLPVGEFHSIDRAGALAHPRWNMGAKISVDSATMMNKGFEVIEAYWLFGLPQEKIEVVVHPESIIHSMVEMADGAVKAQMGEPDMKVPISYALSYPHRLPVETPPLDLAALGSLSFRKPDETKFPCLRLAREALAAGGDRGCVLNAANEVAVGAFLEGRIHFTAIPEIVERSLAGIRPTECRTEDDYRLCDSETRAFASSMIR